MAKKKKNAEAKRDEGVTPDIEREFMLTDQQGRAVRVKSSPLMYAIADEFADRLRSTGGHTEEWLSQKIEYAIYMQAAQVEGMLSPDMPITLQSLAEFMNHYTVEEV